MLTENKCCIITGAAGGIGQALVATFSDAGYTVIATDKEKKPDGLNCGTYLQIELELFVQDEGYADATVSALRNAMPEGRLDVLINNAGIQILGSTGRLTKEDWRKTLDVNVIAPALLVKNLLPELEKGNGKSCVINISSIHASLTKKNFVAYATSKAALSGMTRAMAVDLGGRVRVNAIEPAAVDSKMLRDGFRGREEQYRELESFHPSQCIGTAEDVGRLALTISSDAIGFLHGACIGLHGGIGGKLFDPA